MASYTISPIWGAGAQLFDNSGNVLTGGKIYTYLAGTTTPATTYTTPAGSTANANPIIANAAGRLTNEIWLPISGAYKFVLKDANDVLLATYDNVPTTQQPPIVNDASSISYESGYEVNAGSFTIGETYRITFVGTTDFVAIGAIENQTDELFTATGVGSGTGKAAYVRTVQTKLRETISVKDFGAVGDGVTNDTPALLAAINGLVSGSTLYFPPGTYQVTENAISFNGKDLSLIGENATINIVSGGTGVGVFNFAGSANVRVEGLTFTTSTTLATVFGNLGAAYTASFVATNNTFIGPVSLIRTSGSTTLDPTVTQFGFGYFEYSNNTVRDMIISHMVLSDTPIHVGLISKNFVNNFGFAFFNNGVSNTGSFAEKFKEIGNITIKHNTLICDDDFYNPVGSGSYYVFVLLENNTVTYSYNHVEGMKETAIRATYDAYLSSINVTSTNNVWKNNVNFNLSNSDNWLIKCKSENSPGSPVTKVYSNNTYTITDDWLQRVGKTTADVKHQIYNTGANGGQVVISNCVFDLQTLDVNISQGFKNFVFSNNVIKIKSVAGNTQIVGVYPSSNNATVVIENNTIDVVSGNFYVDAVNNRIFPGITNYVWDSATINNNTVNIKTIDTVANTFVYSFRASNFVSCGNTVKTPLRNDYFDGVFKNALIQNNSFIGSNASGVSNPGTRVLSRNIIYGNSSINNFYNGKISAESYHYLINNPDFPPAATTNYLVTVRFNTASGWKQIEFKYTIQYAAGVFTIVWVDSAGNPRSDVLGTTAGNLITIQSTTTGTGTLTLSAILRNPNAIFQFSGMPTGATNFTIDVQSFE